MKKLLFLFVVALSVPSAKARVLSSGSGISILDSAILNSSGVYTVANDFVGTITIAADNVILDLNYKTITGDGPAIVVEDQRNFRIKNGVIAGSGVCGIVFDRVADAEVRAVNFNNNAVVGLFVTTSTCVVVHDCNFTENDEGMRFENSNSSVVFENRIFGNAGSGIRLTNGCNDMVIERNLAVGNLEGINAEMSASVEVIDNTCNKNANGIVAPTSMNMTICRNTCTNNMVSGISLGGGDHTLLENVTKNNGLGIFLGGTTNSTIARNAADRNSGMAGIRMTGATSNTVIENTVSSNSGMGIELDIGSSSNQVTKNTANRNVEGISNSNALNEVTDNTAIANSVINFGGATPPAPATIQAPGSATAVAGLNLSA